MCSLTAPLENREDFTCEHAQHGNASSTWFWAPSCLPFSSQCTTGAHLSCPQLGDHLENKPRHWLLFLLSRKSQSHFCLFFFQLSKVRAKGALTLGSVGLCFHSLPLHQQASERRALPGEEEGAAAARALRARAALGGPAAGGAGVHRLCPPAEAGLLPGQAGLRR